MATVITTAKVIVRLRRSPIPTSLRMNPARMATPYIRKLRGLGRG